jgi:hypothetical protein
LSWNHRERKKLSKCDTVLSDSLVAELAAALIPLFPPQNSHEKRFSVLLKKKKALPFTFWSPCLTSYVLLERKSLFVVTCKKKKM